MSPAEIPGPPLWEASGAPQIPPTTQKRHSVWGLLGIAEAHGAQQRAPRGPFCSLPHDCWETRLGGGSEVHAGHRTSCPSPWANGTLMTTEPEDELTAPLNQKENPEKSSFPAWRHCSHHQGDIGLFQHSGGKDSSHFRAEC